MPLSTWFCNSYGLPFRGRRVIYYELCNFIVFKTCRIYYIGLFLMIYVFLKYFSHFRTLLALEIVFRCAYESLKELMH
jgi:hypothetical protein